MACDDGQEAHLESLAAQFDQYVDHLKGSFGDIGDQRLTVMAGVMVVDELLELKKKVKTLEEDLASLRESRISQTNESDEIRTDFVRQLDKASEKLEALCAKLSSQS